MPRDWLHENLEKGFIRYSTSPACLLTSWCGDTEDCDLVETCSKTHLYGSSGEYQLALRPHTLGEPMSSYRVTCLYTQTSGQGKPLYCYSCWSPSLNPDRDKNVKFCQRVSIFANILAKQELPALLPWDGLAGLDFTRFHFRL